MTIKLKNSTSLALEVGFLSLWEGTDLTCLSSLCPLRVCRESGGHRAMMRELHGAIGEEALLLKSEPLKKA